MTVPEAAKRAVETLNLAGIPTLVGGGLAVQVHGYPRLTVDADIIVPDIVEAHRVLLRNGYQASVQSAAGVVDPQSKVRVDLRPGGNALTPRCPVAFPMPKQPKYAYLSLPDLISVKLGSFLGSPARRTKDKADVVELIIRNNLRRDFEGLHTAVQSLYVEIWDAIQSEPAAPAS